ncbi:MAG TPA: hypothetical protein VJ746_18140 [Nitrospira sp.]|nr:hypothetical protein [Nitrospira sp.]
MPSNLRRLSLVLLLTGISGCGFFSNQRVTYNQDDARIGLEPDPTISAHQTDVRNAHPANVTGDQMQTLLRAVQVSGWSGTLVGIFVSPQPVPLLSDEELQKYSGPLADAFRLAGPSERIFFSFPKPGGRYSEDRTAGALFMRGRYLHLVLKDHSSILHADTGGGEVRDIRDTKGLKLWTTRPVTPAPVPDAEEPQWAPFETVHMSLNVRDVLAFRGGPLPAPVSREQRATSPTPAEPAPSKQDLQNQIRELTNSNLELRQRLDDQTKRMKELSDEMNRLRLELDQAGSAKPSRKAPAP